MQPQTPTLRTRIISAFGVGSLLLSVLLSVVTYSLTRTSDLEVHQQQALTNTLNNAANLNEHLSAESLASSYTKRMQALATPEGTQIGIIDDAAFYFQQRNDGYLPDDLLFTRNVIPSAFRNALTRDGIVSMTFEIDQIPFFAVGVPLPNPPGNAFYVQAAPLDGVETTLSTLAITLAAASAISTTLAVAFATYVVTRLFNPLASISHAAEQIAEGDLSTRLNSLGDPDLDKLVDSFNHMSHTLEQRIIRDSRFASDVSHELRSPLMTLTGSVSLLERRREELPERSQLALDLLSQEVAKFKLLVDDLLEISRFDIGAVALRTEEVLFEEFVTKAVESANTEQSDIKIIADDCTANSIVKIDKRRIAQVIRNLSENATKYADGVTQVRLTKSANDITIELEDEGPGVPVEERELIFDRFARGSEGGRRGDSTGVGLGLSLVREHLKLHGGSISVTDRLDGRNGARFIISLPEVVAHVE